MGILSTTVNTTFIIDYDQLAVPNSKAGLRLSYKSQCLIGTTISGGKENREKLQDTLNLGRRKNGDNKPGNKT